jgi:Tfp pilus assembly protein PilF
MAKRRTISYAVSQKPKALASAQDFKEAIRDSLALLQRGENDAASEKLRSIIAAVPRHAEALQLMGSIALLGGKPGEAIEWLERALAVDPRHAIACSNLGLALRRLQRNDEALAQFEKAAALNPGYAEAHSNSGVVLNELGRFSEALAAYDRAIAINPNYAQAHCNRGVALNNLNRQAEAIAGYDRAIALKPDYAAAHWNRCLVHLAIGNFRHAWDEYAWRWKNREITQNDKGQRPFWYGTRQHRGKHDLPHGVPCAFDAPFWDGSPNRDSLLVWPEQGVGEQLLYSSMLNEARARVGKLTLILQQKLHPLFQRSFPKCRIVTFETAIAENNFDWQIPLGDLGRFFLDTAEDRLSQRKAYIKADRTRTAAIRREIAPGKQRIVGLSWYSRNAEYGAQKTVSLDQFAPLLGMPGLRFVDLQYGDTTAARAAIQRKSGVEITRVASVDNWEDIDGFAALVNACDLIVTISNTTAHIAGALGKPVILMLPQSQGRFWYWQTARDDSIFYPDVRILRQHSHGNWSAVIEQACTAAATLKLKSGKS